MDALHYLVDFILHVDEHLAVLIAAYGMWTYVILFLIIFCETGLVVTPFLPGDSLFFAAGALCATAAMDVGLLFVLLTLAAILGDTVNYSIGARLGVRLFQLRVPLLKHEHLVRTQRFYARHGGKTIVIARFAPIIRTFAPFVAGMGAMQYGRFLTYNVVGGVVWIASFLFAGYFFGSVPVVQENFGLVVVAIIVVSVLPGVVAVVRDRLRGRAAA